MFNLCFRHSVSVYVLALSFAIWFRCQGIKAIHHPTGEDLSLKHLSIIVLSQFNKYHQQEAAKFKKHFQEQILLVDEKRWPELLFTHQDFVDVHGTWTIFPLVQYFFERKNDQDFAWVLICEEDTRVNISGLVTLLQKYDASQKWFLGREFRDQQTTIIHHFAFADKPSQLAYPDFRAGFVLSKELVKHLVERIQKEKLKTDFSIDPKYELALFVWNDGKGTELTHIKQFCSVDDSIRDGCITTQLGKFPNCGHPVDKYDLFVAVKTCKQFHDTRIPVVKSTWGKTAAIIEYYSEIEDKNIPTVDLLIPNTERGHCGKTMAIIHQIMNTSDLSALSWILIADDDTIINLEQLRSLLSCYNARQPVALGERYGFGVVRQGGYDYLTGGGGMVFSQPAIKLLSERCSCYSHDAPDDMTLGMCLKAIGVPLTHSRFFHQARPVDYSPDFLANQIPISFHKHWNNDPYKVYADLIAWPRGESQKPNFTVQQSWKEEL